MNQCIANDPKQRSQSYEHVASIIAELKLMILIFARESGQSADAVKSEFAIHYNEQSKLIRNRCDNTASLIFRYSEQCRSLVENYRKSLQR